MNIQFKAKCILNHSNLTQKGLNDTFKNIKGFLYFTRSITFNETNFTNDSQSIVLDSNSLFIKGYIVGLEEGMYTLHIHTLGDLTNIPSSLGPILNKSYLNNVKELNSTEIGDLGTINSENEITPVHINIQIKNISLEDCVGRSIVISKYNKLPQQINEIGKLDKKRNNKQNLKINNTGNSLRSETAIVPDTGMLPDRKRIDNMCCRFPIAYGSIFYS